MGEQLDDLFRAEHRHVRQFASRLVGPATADDIVAATFELALRKLSTSHPHPVGWLFRTARNLCKAELRRQHRDFVAAEEAARLSSPAPGGDTEILLEILDRLPDGQREVLKLTYWDNLTAAEVGLVLGCTERAVWKRVSRAKAALRAAWPVLEDSDLWEGLVTHVSVRDH